MTKAFDTALFVPPESPDTGQAVGIDVIGTPYDSSWYYYVIAPGPGITLGATIPAPTDEGQILIGGPGPNFQWLTSYPLYLGALAAPPDTSLGTPRMPDAGTMYYNTSDKTPYILTFDPITTAPSWVPLPVATAPRLTISASLPAATQSGQMLVAGGLPGGGVYPWQASVGMFLGAFASVPVGNFPIGSIYYNTSNNTTYVWSGTGWVSIVQPSKSATASLFYEATVGQTDFVTTVNDLFGKTHTFDAATNEGVEVHLNGVLLTPDGSAVTGDYTLDPATSTVALLVGAPINAILCIDVLEDPINLAPTIVLLEKLNALAFDGVKTQFPLILSTGLGFTVADPVDLHVSLDGVEQEPGVDYVLNTAGTDIIFAEAPTVDVRSWIIYYAKSKTGFLTSVEHDGTLSGDGTVSSPLSAVMTTDVADLAAVVTLLVAKVQALEEELTTLKNKVH